MTRDLLYDEHTNKQFITVQTAGGSTFYIVIDYDKPVDEEGEQYETYFLNMVDEADLLAAAEAAGVEQAVCSCSEKCAAGAVNTDCPVCSLKIAECVGVEPEPEPAETEEPAPEEAEPETDGPDEEEIQYSVAQIKEATKKLPAGYRIILSLYLFEGYDMEEIASILKIQPPSVRSQYLRAKRKLLDIIAANKENG